MRLSSQPCADEGFSLAETLVALAIITTGLFALLGGFITAASSIQAQQEDARAVRVALDRYEQLRLKDWENDPELVAGGSPVSGSAVGSNGKTYDYTTTISERDSRPGEDIPGDIVKDVTTVVTWTGRNGKVRDVTYTGALAQDARTIGLPSGYIQAIRSMSIAPDPSVIVDFDGFTTEPIYVTVSMTGHDNSDLVTIRWTDDSGPKTAIAQSTDTRFWRVTLPARSAAGVKRQLATGQQAQMTFTATTATGLTAQSSLTLFGPVLNAPVITSFTSSSNPVRTFNNGGNRYQNRDDVTISCLVDGLDTAAGSIDSVKLNYIGESGAAVEQTMTRTGVSGSRVTYTHLFPKSTTYFGTGVDLPWTCVVRRASDGGPASRTLLVSVGKN